MGSRQGLRDYLKRHALNEACFSSRARAVDAVRMALACEPLSRARAQTRWEREAEGLYRSSNGDWRLQREAGRGRLSPLSREARAKVASYPELGRILARERAWTLECYAEWIDRIEQYLADLERQLAE